MMTRRMVAGECAHVGLASNRSMLVASVNPSSPVVTNSGCVGRIHLRRSASLYRKRMRIIGCTRLNGYTHHTSSAATPKIPKLFSNYQKPTIVAVSIVLEFSVLYAAACQPWTRSHMLIPLRISSIKQ